MNTATHSKEKMAQFVWMGFIVMFFVIQALIWAVAISLTSHDPSHAVVAGYDQQALNWDNVQRLQKASDELKWTAEFQVRPTSDVHGNRTLVLNLKDSDLNPIENANVDIDAFHCGQAARVQQLQLQEMEAGVYSGVIRIQRSGRWQLTGSATVGESCFLIAQKVVLSTAGDQ